MFNNPYLFNQARQNMTAENIKSASERMASMSDSELQNMAKMAGFNVSPELLKTSANMMKNMDPNELERMKNMAGSFNPSASTFNTSNSNFNAPPKTPPPPNYNNSTSSIPYTNTSSYQKIEALKKKGNDLFSQGKFEEAGTVYFEAILDIEEIKSGEGWENGGKGSKWEELKLLEIACRLNYAISKSKVEEWDVVLTQGKEVLKLGENGKARFRVGQALHNLGKNETALTYLEKAKEMLPNDSTVKSYYEKVKASINPPATSASEPNNLSSIDPSPPLTPSNLASDSSSSIPSVNKDNLKPVIKKKNVVLESVTPNENKKTPIVRRADEEEKKRDDYILTEEKSDLSQPRENEFQGFSENLPENKSNQARMSAEQLKNMSPEQMKTMSSYFQSMDNSFLRQMMKQQSGMDMSDAEIESLKQMMTPETLQMMSNMNLDSFKNTESVPSFSKTATTSNATPNVSTPPQTMPNFGSGLSGISNLMENKDLMNNMMDNLKKNPEILKGMSKMLGANNPLSSVLEKSSPEDLQRMMGMMQGLMGFVGKISRLFIWIKKNFIPIILVIITLIIYNYFL